MLLLLISLPWDYFSKKGLYVGYIYITPPAKVLPWYSKSIAHLILKGIKVGLGAFGKQPDVIITPYTPKQIEVLASTNWLQFVMRNPMIYPRIMRTEPISGAVNVFTDGSKVAWE